MLAFYGVNQLKIVSIEVAKLSSDPANARKHNQKNIDSIVASLRRFGQQKPIIVDSFNVVRAGNGLLQAAKQLGIEYVDCVVTDLKNSDAVAYAIADNRTAELAEWDDEILAAQLNALLTESEELALCAGFTTDEIEAIVGKFDVEAIAPPNLENGDREPFRQITFTVHDSQYEVIDSAIKRAKAIGFGDFTVNENSNGNALFLICEAFNG